MVKAGHMTTNWCGTSGQEALGPTVLTLYAHPYKNILTVLKWLLVVLLPLAGVVASIVITYEFFLGICGTCAPYCGVSNSDCKYYEWTLDIFASLAGTLSAVSWLFSVYEATPRRTARVIWVAFFLGGAVALPIAQVFPIPYL